MRPLIVSPVAFQTIGNQLKFVNHFHNTGFEREINFEQEIQTIFSLKSD